MQFDAYIMVDWSANNSPKTGKDSIWYCVVERIDDVSQATLIANRGSVGSQALVGIPYIDRLRHHTELSSFSRVWPHPSIKIFDQGDDECKDLAQVRGLAKYFAGEDEAGRLRDLFDTPSGLSPETISQIVSEEGWTLGVR